MTAVIRLTGKLDSEASFTGGGLPQTVPVTPSRSPADSKSQTPSHNQCHWQAPPPPGAAAAPERASESTVMALALAALTRHWQRLRASDN